MRRLLYALVPVALGGVCAVSADSRLSPEERAGAPARVAAAPEVSTAVNATVEQRAVANPQTDSSGESAEPRGQAATPAASDPAGAIKEDPGAADKVPDISQTPVE
jgi:hypothetical protein